MWVIKVAIDYFLSLWMSSGCRVFVERLPLPTELLWHTYIHLSILCCRGRDGLFLFSLLCVIDLYFQSFTNNVLS